MKVDRALVNETTVGWLPPLPARPALDISRACQAWSIVLSALANALQTLLSIWPSVLSPAAVIGQYTLPREERPLCDVLSVQQTAQNVGSRFVELTPATGLLSTAWPVRLATVVPPGYKAVSMPSNVVSVLQYPLSEFAMVCASGSRRAAAASGSTPPPPATVSSHRPIDHVWTVPM